MLLCRYVTVENSNPRVSGLITRHYSTEDEICSPNGVRLDGKLEPIYFYYSPIRKAIWLLGKEMGQDFCSAISHQQLSPSCDMNVPSRPIIQ